MRNIFTAILGLVLAFTFSCSTSMKQGTKATLRPDLSKNDTEIWEIYSGGNGYTSVEKVEQNAYQRAALTAYNEGYDCFIVLDSESDVKTYTYTNYEKRTVTGSSYGNYNYTGSTNYYGKSGSYLGNANNSGSIRGHTNTQQEVYVPQTRNINKASKRLYVVFEKYDRCVKLGESKWRKNIYFNEDILETVNLWE